MGKIFGYSPLYLGLAALAGMMMAIQGTINSALGDRLGPGETNFIVHTTAVLILVGILIITREKVSLQILHKTPWYLYLGGLIGVIITYGVILSIPRLGVAVATTSIITAQVLTAAAIDHLGFFGLDKVPFSWLRVVGIIFLAIGVRLLLE
ncbi:MAG: DMT family transporter [Halanaerobiales bacterium]